MSTEAILTRLIARNHHSAVLREALLDSLFAIRRITWTPGKRS